MQVFKGFLPSALYICSEKYLAQEMKFLKIIFAENWHSTTISKKVSKEYMSNITFVNEKENIETTMHIKTWTKFLQKNYKKI